MRSIHLLPSPRPQLSTVPLPTTARAARRRPESLWLRRIGRLPGWMRPSTTAGDEEDDVSELTRPGVTVPDGPAPADLVIEDQVVGDGAEAIVGSQIQAHYVGVAHSNG